MINQTEIATLVKTATIVNSESGRVAGPRCREEYRLADGRILELTWDESAGTSAYGMPRIVEFVISSRSAKNWRVSR
jgi:hypothetical protein